MISLYGQVEFTLRNKILSGQYEFGEKLPSENELVERFGVSKITVRHALARLEADRLIHVDADGAGGAQRRQGEQSRRRKPTRQPVTRAGEQSMEAVAETVHSSGL